MTICGTVASRQIFVQPVGFLHGNERRHYLLRIPQPSPKFLNFIQVRAVRRQEYELQALPVLFQQLLKQLRMTELCIIKDYGSFPVWIHGPDILQKLQKDLRIIFFVFFHINMAGLIVQAVFSV